MNNDEGNLPIFDVQRVQLRFDISAEFVAAQVANNVLILALSSGRILRFDLDNAEDIDDIDLPKRPAEIGVIRKAFMDPSASHLIISTALGENYYLHTQSRQPKALSRLKGVQIECIAWNPSLPTASTREILVGAADGNVYETYIEPSTEFYRREEKYVKNVYKSTAGPITGIWADTSSARPDARRVLVSTPTRLLHFVGKNARAGGDGTSIYTKLFESETPRTRDAVDGSRGGPSSLTISPDPAERDEGVGRSYGWLGGQSVVTGSLVDAAAADAAQRAISSANALSKSRFVAGQTPSKSAKQTLQAIALTQFHILVIFDDRLVAINRLDESLVFDQRVLEADQQMLGLYVDHQKNTFWLLTQREIYEIVVTDESRHICQIMLNRNNFDLALNYAKTPLQKDMVAVASGDHLLALGRYKDAASAYGKSSKSFEEVALTFIDKSENDALRLYLVTKLAHLKKAAGMQRTMVASWLVELYMAKLNDLDDTLSAATDQADGAGTIKKSDDLPAFRKEFNDFVSKNKSDLDRDAVYEIISSHGRETELLYFASVVEDYSYVLSYWVQREHWADAMAVLKKQSDLDLFYRYSNVLMEHSPSEFVDVLMRQTKLDETRLIPALLTYNKTLDVPLSQNQAVRFLSYCINQQGSRISAIHNTLVSIYAASPVKDESALLAYLEAQSTAQVLYYDADFALRLCINHQRVRSTVHIYCAMGQFPAAVDTALRYDEVDIAAEVADRPENDAALRKKLWLKVAKKVMAKSEGISAALTFLKRCEFLRIEDLIPLFPDFIVIDDFKEEICEALEEYSRQIDNLRLEMERSADTTQNIKDDIRALDQRYAIVEPGERCWLCRLPVLMRQFFVFPCQHAFHADCLARAIVGMIPAGKARRIKELQAEIGRGVVAGKKREKLVRELDGLVAGQCVLCGELAVRRIDEPFVTAADSKDEWAIHYFHHTARFPFYRVASLDLPCRASIALASSETEQSSLTALASPPLYSTTPDTPLEARRLLLFSPARPPTIPPHTSGNASSSSNPRRPANIPLHSLSASPAGSSHRQSRAPFEDSKRASIDSSGGDSDFSLWSDTGDLVDQLASEDPLQAHGPDAIELETRRHAPRQHHRDAAPVQKRVRYEDWDDEGKGRDWATPPRRVRAPKKKEDIAIPDPKRLPVGAAHRLLASIMAPNDGHSRMHGLHGQKLLYFTSVFVSLGVFLFGYDQGVMSGIITGPYFKDYFNQPTRAEVGTMVAILEVGAFIASLVVGRIGDILGRKKTILYGAAVFLIGGAFQTFATGMPMMLVGRIVAGLGVGALSTIVPVYQSEISPPTHRGRLAAVEFSGNILGYAASVWVDYACTYIRSDWSWRVPLLMQVVMGALLAAGSFLIPESPRWLLDNDFDEEGIVVIANLYGKGDIHNQKARDEYREIKMNVLLQRQEGERSYADMFKRYSKRVFIAMSAQALAQLNGINVISYYAPLVFEQAGWAGRAAILMTGINALTYLGSTIPPWYLVDRLGRRPILLGGAVAMMISLSAISYFIFIDIRATPTLVVVFVMIYNASFGASWGPIPWLYPPEILPLSIRAKGASLSTAANWAFNWLVGELTPVLQEAIQWRLYLVHAFFCAVSFVVVWFIYPETANVRLEDMNSLFGDATTMAPTPETLAQAESLFSGRSPPTSLHLGEEQDGQIPNIDLNPPEDVKGTGQERGEGLGGWISNLVKKGNGASGKYKRVADEDD